MDVGLVTSMWGNRTWTRQIWAVARVRVIAEKGKLVMPMRMQ